MVKDIIVKAIGGYLKACFQIMIVIFAILFIIFLLMGQKYAAPIAFITAFLDFLPLWVPEQFLHHGLYIV